MNKAGWPEQCPLWIISDQTVLGKNFGLSALPTNARLAAREYGLIVG